MYKIKGFDEFSKELKRLSKNAKRLDGENNVSFTELFTREFMVKYTDFSSFEELLEAGNFIVNSQEDFEAIPDDVFDEHIKSVTKFSSWREMLEKASAEWVEKKLFE
jgi:hypothetical protein